MEGRTCTWPVGSCQHTYTADMVLEEQIRALEGEVARLRAALDRTIQAWGHVELDPEMDPKGEKFASLWDARLLLDGNADTARS